MELRQRLDGFEGLTTLSVWHNGQHWAAAGRLGDSVTEMGFGETPSAATLAALAGLEALRGKTVGERCPYVATAPALVANRKRDSGPVDEFDGY